MDGAGLVTDLPGKLLVAPVIQCATSTFAIWAFGFIIGWLVR